MRAAAAMNYWEGVEHQRLQLACLSGILLGPALSVVPVIVLGLDGPAALVVAALVMCLTGAVTFARQTQRVLDGHRALQRQLEERVGDGPSLGELAAWFPAFILIESGYYIVAIGEWDYERGDRRTAEDADRLALEAGEMVSRFFQRRIPVRWSWEEEEHGYSTWDRGPRPSADQFPTPRPRAIHRR